MGLRKMIAKAFNYQGTSNATGVGMYGNATIPKSYPWDWWSRDMRPDAYQLENTTTVEACVSTIAQTIAMLPIKHEVFMGDDMGYVEDKYSTVANVLSKPNPYQTKSEFIVDLVRSMLLTGNGYGVVMRNEVYDIESIYPQRKLSPYISFDSKDVYYGGADNVLIDIDSMIPARDVLHVKMHTTSHPLVGVTPLVAATLSATTANSIQGHTNTFFKNMSRPSGVLSTDLMLTADQTKELRIRFNDVSQDLNTGGLPILTAGLKYQGVTMNAVDSAIIDTYNMTKSDIASIFRVPLALIGDMEKATFANTESLMKYWISSGLGFILEHIENSLHALFNLPPTERINFDTEFLLRADFKDRIEGYKVGVTGGIFTPNEIRVKEGFKKLEGGDNLFMQMQNTPIDANGRKMDAEIEKIEQEVINLKKEPITPQAPQLDKSKSKSVSANELDSEICLALIDI